MNDSMQMMNQAQIGNAPSGINPIPPNIVSQKPPVMVQPQTANQPSAVLNAVKPQIMNQTQGQMMTHNVGVNQQPVMLMKRGGFVSWPQQPSTDPNHKFQLPPSILKHPRNNKNWKGKNAGKKEHRRNEIPVSTAIGLGGPNGYQPPSLKELQMQNRAKARKYYHSKKKYYARFAPYAPRNTTSFIIRAKKSGGIASLVSPCPVTPAVLPTPIFSPSREILGDTAKEEWGVDGYGSMKGLIRLRSPGHEIEANEDEDDEEGNGSSESDVEEHVEVERRLDHDLSRFEMIYPSYGGGINVGDSFYSNVLENRVDDQDTHIAHLEEENLTLKERLFLMEREMGDLKRRLHFLERQRGGSHNSLILEGIHEEIMENVSENDENESYGGSDAGVNGSDNLVETYLGDDKETESDDHTQEVGDIFEAEEASAADAGANAQVILNEILLDQADGKHGCNVEASAKKNDSKVEDEVFPPKTTIASPDSSMHNAAMLCE